MKISRMLPLLEDLEGSVAELYRGYAEMFKDDHDASAVFSAMSEEELVHQEIVKHVRLLIASNPSSFPSSFSDTEEDINVVFNALKKIKQAQRSEKPVSVEEAIRFALMIEVMATEWYDIKAVAETEPKYAKFLRIFLESQGHLKKLVDFAESRGWTCDIDVESVRAKVSA
jgi:rubrerythrin